MADSNSIQAAEDYVAWSRLMLDRDFVREAEEMLADVALAMRLSPWLANSALWLALGFPTTGAIFLLIGIGLAVWDAA